MNPPPVVPRKHSLLRPLPPDGQPIYTQGVCALFNCCVWKKDRGHFIILFIFSSLNNINEQKMCFCVAVKPKGRVRHPEQDVVCMNKLSMHM